MGKDGHIMFGNSEKKEKSGEKDEKVVDIGGWSVVLYSSAREKGSSREGHRERENLENDTERMEETTVNSEMSFT